MAKSRPTIIDVAKKAGVSKSTVSLVLQNSSTVREETRKQVRTAMRDLGYVYNRSAANMRKSNAALIGLVINNLRNPFFTEFATSLQMALSEKGYAVVIANTDERADLQDQVVLSMIEHGVSAFILCPAYGDTKDTFDAIERAGLPALQVLRRVDERVETFPFIAPDYRTGSVAATEHMIRAGAKNIAFIGGRAGLSVTDERMSGYLAVLQREGQQPTIITGDSTREFGRKTARDIQQNHPELDAAVCFNDLVALGLNSGMREAGKAVGKDFLIVGFDDIEDAAQAYPAISSVSCGIDAIGKRSAETIVHWIEQGNAPVVKHRTPVELILRDSS
ncbi:LacI family DNA-binding transcriptional regulator [Cognatishimia activa]|uniref:LacI family DNA-binding transcriptional regulator n=1 Tax=Cognatishimia activa TaxID=1715691 RepID=UPI002232AC70|nr:LacI family DNA-binding transcriptional regulator [Cognatishimia activa]UZD91256.1 LacI family DNA-binding transcriptional regulator [Cognatishimia activa]